MCRRQLKVKGVFGEWKATVIKWSTICDNVYLFVLRSTSIRSCSKKYLRRGYDGIGELDDRKEREIWWDFDAINYALEIIKFAQNTNTHLRSSPSNTAKNASGRWCAVRWWRGWWHCGVTSPLCWRGSRRSCYGDLVTDFILMVPTTVDISSSR